MSKFEHIDTCPRCGSQAVYEDVEASSEPTDRGVVKSVGRHWYDCLGCGARLMKVEEISADPDLEQEDDVGRGVSEGKVDVNLEMELGLE